MNPETASSLDRGDRARPVSSTTSTSSCRRPDGTTIWARDSARAIRDEAGEVMYYEGSLIDVTDKIEAQKAKDEFIATVSHELRNPIAAMLGLGQELANNYDTFTDEDRREMAQMIARQADDASWLIEDLLVAYGDDLNGVSIHPEVFDVVKEIERVLEVEEHPIELQVFDGSSQVNADPRRTRQILKNLVSNALRHGGETVSVALAKVGDRIEVKVQRLGRGDTRPRRRADLQSLRNGESRRPSRARSGWAWPWPVGWPA